MKMSIHDSRARISLRTSRPETYTSKWESFINSLLMYVVIQFPVSSMLKVYISPLNTLLTALLFLLFFAYYIYNRFYIQQFLLALYTLFALLYNIVACNGHFYEDNMLFYLPCMLLFFNYIKSAKNHIIQFVRVHKLYVDVILIIWMLMVIPSFFMSSCYVYEGETRGFVSFAGTTFLLSPMSIYIFALLTLQYYLHRKTVYALALVVPSLCILMGTTRTYLAVLFCAWAVFIYLLLDNKKAFAPIVLIAMIAFLLIVVASPISEKFINTADRASTGMDPIKAFTSGRSDFWAYDVQQILSSNPINILIGHGSNWLYEINRAQFNVPLWAHNDFIQIASDYGFIGLIVYLGSFASLYKTVIKGRHHGALIMLILVVMWAFNAFFNMFYTYFCAMLSYPIYLLMISEDFDKAATE